jgi:YD repeat-containing protein
MLTAFAFDKASSNLTKRGTTMSDVARWKVHGAVETLRKEFATWDLDQQDWQPGRHITLASFRPDGTISSTETHNPDGSIARSQSLYDDANRLIESNSRFNDGPITWSVYFYDEAGHHIKTTHLGDEGTQTDTEICTYDADGKRTEVCALPVLEGHVAYGIEGTEHSYSAPGVRTMTTTYDQNDLPTKVLFLDANGSPVMYVTLMRDEAGRLVNEEMHLGGESPFLNVLEHIPLEEREEAVAMITKAFGDPFSSSAYTYDDRGRLIERMDRMGGLGECRTTYRYDEHGDPIEETSENRHREANADANGAMQYTSDRLNIQHNRFEYVYDAHGNWTERIVSIQFEPNAAFQRSNIERRVITYHAGS